MFPLSTIFAAFYKFWSIIPFYFVQNIFYIFLDFCVPCVI